MPASESELATELSTRHHVTTRKRFQRLAISRRVIDGLCCRGRLEHIGNGVLVSPAGAEPFEQRLGVACALTGRVIRLPTAGTVWEFRKTPAVERVTDIAIDRHLEETIGDVLAVCNRVRAAP